MWRLDSLIHESRSRKSSIPLSRASSLFCVSIEVAEANCPHRGARAGFRFSSGFSAKDALNCRGLITYLTENRQFSHGHIIHRW